VLTTSFHCQLEAEKNLRFDGYNGILANPPFSGRLDRDRIVDDVKIGASTATELLFVKYMIDNLKRGWRRGVVVPEGVFVQFSSCSQRIAPHADAEQPRGGGAIAVRRRSPTLFRHKTSVLLIFGQGGRTERVMFLHASNDGFKLDANHEQPIEADELPGLIAAFNSREELFADWRERNAPQTWTEN
jgi:type I restriction enzyme M protein